MATSTVPRRSAAAALSVPRPDRRGWRAVATIAARSSAVIGAACPRPAGPFRRNPLSTRVVAGPVGSATPANFAWNLTAATASAALATVFRASRSVPGGLR